MTEGFHDDFVPVSIGVELVEVILVGLQRFQKGYNVSVTTSLAATRYFLCDMILVLTIFCQF